MSDKNLRKSGAEDDLITIKIRFHPLPHIARFYNLT